jgi:hypothetical protein
MALAGQFMVMILERVPLHSYRWVQNRTFQLDRPFSVPAYLHNLFHLARQTRVPGVSRQLSSFFPDRLFILFSSIHSCLANSSSRRFSFPV